MIECWRCHGPHPIAECPMTDQDAGGHPDKPIWCGECDPQTRLVDHGDRMSRCICHPLHWKLLPQHKRCGGCKTIVYSWDMLPCGSHLILAR